PIASRAFAITHTAMFDAWAAYDPVAKGTRLGNSLRRPEVERTAANKEKAMSFAAYRVLVDLFLTQTAIFDLLMSALGYDPSDISADTSSPSGIGNVCAQALLNYRHTDGSNQLGDLHPGACRSIWWICSTIQTSGSHCWLMACLKNGFCRSGD